MCENQLSRASQAGDLQAKREVQKPKQSHVHTGSGIVFSSGRVQAKVKFNLKIKTFQIKYINGKDVCISVLGGVVAANSSNSDTGLSKWAGWPCG